MAVASHFIELSTEYAVIPSDAKNLIICGASGVVVTFSSDSSGTDTLTLTPSAATERISTSVLHHVKVASGTAKLYYGV